VEPGTIIIAATAISIGLILGAAGLGSAIGWGLITAKALEGIARQPEMRPQLLFNMFIFAGLMEPIRLCCNWQGEHQKNRRQTLNTRKVEDNCGTERDYFWAMDNIFLSLFSANEVSLFAPQQGDEAEDGQNSRGIGCC